MKLSEKLVQNVACYIDENYVAAYEQDTYGGPFEQSRRARYQMPRIFEDCMPAPCAPAPTAQSSLSLDEFISKKEAGFTETLLSLIKESGQKNSAIYKKANITKQHFSKIINDPEYKPTKATAIALALPEVLWVDFCRELPLVRQ